MKPFRNPFAADPSQQPQAAPPAAVPAAAPAVDPATTGSIRPRAAAALPQTVAPPPRRGLLGTMFGGGGDDGSGSGWSSGLDDDPRSRINKLGAMLMMLDPMSREAGMSMLQLEQNRATTNYALHRQNQTAQWLQTQGLGGQEASFLASDPNALNEWYKQWNARKNPKWEMHELYNSQHQKVNVMIDMNTGKLSQIGGAAPPTITNESGFDADGRETRFLLNHDDGTRIPLGTKSDVRSQAAQEQELELRRNTQPSTVIQGENKQAQDEGAALAKSYNDLQSTAFKSNASLGTLGLMQNAVESDGFKSGGGAVNSQFNLQMKQLAKQYGWSIGDNDLVDEEMFNSLSKQAVMEKLGSLGTGISNEDRNMINDMVPNLGVSKETNLALIRIQQRILQQSQVAAKEMRAFKKAHGGILTDDVYDHMEDWAKLHPIFSKEDNDYIKGLAAASKAQGGGAGAPELGTPDDDGFAPVKGRPGVRVRIGGAAPAAAPGGGGY